MNNINSFKSLGWKNGRQEMIKSIILKQLCSSYTDQLEFQWK